METIVWIIVTLLVVSYYFYMAAVDTRKNTQRAYAIDDCIYVHSENGLDYPWLADIHGGLSHIMWSEPPEANNWRPYNDAVWRNHCKMVDHTKNLVENHMNAFVNKDTRFAKLMFVFRDGYKTEPTREFYEREAKWFADRYLPVNA